MKRYSREACPRESGERESRKKKTGFPRIEYGAGLVKPGMTSRSQLAVYLKGEMTITLKCPSVKPLQIPRAKIMQHLGYPGRRHKTQSRPKRSSPFPWGAENLPIPAFLALGGD